MSAIGNYTITATCIKPDPTDREGGYWRAQVVSPYGTVAFESHAGRQASALNCVRAVASQRGIALPAKSALEQACDAANRRAAQWWKDKA